MGQAFEDEDALPLRQTQTSGEFDITLLGIAFGSSLQTYLPQVTVAADSAYAVVALSRNDGAPMPPLSPETDGIEVPDLFMTFLAPNFAVEDNPLNQTTGAVRLLQDGVYYQLVSCKGLSLYGQEGFYLSVNEGNFCRAEAFSFDEASGRLSLDETYQKIHALFEISLSRELLEQFSENPPAPSPYDRDLSQPAAPGSIANPPDPEDALPSAGWTLKQREALNALSLPDKILYITKDRILTGHESAEANGFVMQAYDYTGTLLAEKEFACQKIDGSPARPYCTAYGFALPSGRGFEVYDYDFRLLYAFDMADIPTRYPAAEHSFSGEVLLSVPYDADGCFSSNLQYFCCNIFVEDQGINVRESWFYDAAGARWSLLYHDYLAYEELARFHFYMAVPANDGHTLMFRAAYYESEAAVLPGNSATQGYGLFSPETGEVLYLQNGSPEITAAGNRFLADFEIPAREPRYAVVLDSADCSDTVVSLDCENKRYYTRISPDGRFLISCDEDAAADVFVYRVYDLQKNTVSEPLSVSYGEGPGISLRCYPGGFRLFQTHTAGDGTFLGETSLGFYPYEP
ncbi:MAG: hypothetical protein HFI39_13330 [Lachnospiraceae bacterium]|nr:hypothetical protein [Lachnospiraceae bacterium]